MEKLKINMSIEEDTDILAKMKEAYMACPSAIKYVRELGIPEDKIDENITRIYDFVSDINYCRKCPGIKNCAKHNPLLCTKIVYEEGLVDRQLVPCPKFIERVAFEKQFLIRDFDDAWLDVKITDLDNTKDRTAALQKYVKFIKEGKNDWIYLTGGPNSGRSFLAAAFATDAARKNVGPVCFVNCSTRIGEIASYYAKEKDRFQKEIERLSNCQILVLDDFGNEFKNDMIRDAILFPIISNRANKKLFTIVTSDFSINEIVTLYSTSKAGEIRANQIGKLIKAVAGKEINLGELSIYR